MVPAIPEASQRSSCSAVREGRGAGVVMPQALNPSSSARAFTSSGVTFDL